MIQASEEIIDELGIAGFSAREAARRAGVSPGAPAYHFSDSRGLLTAVAAAAFRRFGEALETAGGESEPKGLLRSQAIAYLRFALREREKFLLMWRIDLIDRSSPDYSEAVQGATGVLMRTGRSLTEQALEEQPLRNVEDRIARLNNPNLTSGVAVWALVHGFSTLAINGVFGDPGNPQVDTPEQRLLELLDRLVI